EELAGTKCNLWQTRFTWVSTAKAAIPKPFVKTTFAVLRPTPGRVIKSLRLSGTTPLKSFTNLCDIFFKYLDLLFDRPMLCMISRISSNEAAAIDSGVGN